MGIGLDAVKSGVASAESAVAMVAPPIRRPEFSRQRAGSVELAGGSGGGPASGVPRRGRPLRAGPARFRGALRQAQQLLVHQERPVAGRDRQRCGGAYRVRQSRRRRRCGGVPAAALLSRVRPPQRPVHRPSMGAGGMRCFERRGFGRKGLHRSRTARSRQDPARPLPRPPCTGRNAQAPHGRAGRAATGPALVAAGEDGGRAKA